MIVNHVHSRLETRRIEKATMIVREIYIYTIENIKRLARSIINARLFNPHDREFAFGKLRLTNEWRDENHVQPAERKLNGTRDGTMIKVHMPKNSWHIYTFSYYKLRSEKFAEINNDVETNLDCGACKIYIYIYIRSRSISRWAKIEHPLIILSIQEKIVTIIVPPYKNKSYIDSIIKSQYYLDISSQEHRVYK